MVNLYGAQSRRGRVRRATRARWSLPGIRRACMDCGTRSPSVRIWSISINEGSALADGKVRWLPAFRCKEASCSPDLASMARKVGCCRVALQSPMTMVGTGGWLSLARAAMPLPHCLAPRWGDLG